jgi:hypothetical protein
VLTAVRMVRGTAAADRPRRARADEWNKLTCLTFSKDVAIPGKVLTATAALPIRAAEPCARLALPRESGARLYMDRCSCASSVDVLASNAWSR